LGEITAIFRRTALAPKEIDHLPIVKIVELTAVLLDVDAGEDPVDQKEAGIFVVQGCGHIRLKWQRSQVRSPRGSFEGGDTELPGIRPEEQGMTPKYRKNSLVNICLLN
jgi:hypothetical protein